MRIMLAAFSAALFIAVGAFFVLDSLGFSSAARQSSPFVRLD